MNDPSDYDYKKYLQLIIKKKYLFVSLALIIMAGVAGASFMLPERYEAKCTVFIEKSLISELVKGIAITSSTEDKLRGLAYTLKSRSLLLKVFDDLGLNTSKKSSEQLEQMVRGFQDNTDVKLKDKEGLFIITFVNENPRVARDYVNALVRRYIEENTTSKQEESSGATSFLSGQISAIRAKLEEAEARENSYKQGNGGVLAQNEVALLADVAQAQQKIAEIEIKRRQLESLQSLARKNDPLKAKLAALKKRQQELGLVYTDIHPEVVEINNEIAAVTQQLQSGSTRSDFVNDHSLEAEKISLELNSLRDMENSQRRLIASRQSLLRSIPAARSGLDELEREKNSQKMLYEQLVARYGQSEVSRQMEMHDKSTTFRIEDPALLPNRPFSPNRIKIILFGIVGGVMASFGFLVLLDHLDKSVRNIEALKSLGVQVLAVIPTIENQVELQAARKRDYWFYGIAAVCFMLVLATIPLELLRPQSIDLFKNLTLK